MSSGSRWRELGQDQWIEIAKAMYSRFGEVQITDRIAALTHYAVLSLFPGLLVAVAILALVGEYPRTCESIVDTLRDAAPGTAVDAINSGLRDALSDRGNAGALLGVGLAISLYARWSTGAASLLTAFAMVYSLGPRKGPRRGTRSLPSVLPGAILGVILWFVVSLAFTAYLANFGAYDKTYGTLGAMISLLIWLWLGSLAFLLGALFNAESQRVRGGSR
jgi:uncharacterized BrkB/YihY/UPF0761 family membrane protein